MNKIKVKIYSNNFNTDNCANWRANLQYNGGIDGLEFTFSSDIDYNDDMLYDVIFLSRPLINYIGYIRELKSAGKKVVVDYDDCFPMMFSGNIKEHIIECLSIIEESDIITTTTDSLKEYFYYHSFKDNIQVLPNIINKKFIDDYKKINPHSVILGWYGSQGHFDNISLISDTILNILDQYSNVYLDLYSPSEKINCLFNHPKVNKIDYIFNFEKFQTSISNIDINLSPLVENYFNLHKSNIRIILPGYKGIPSIASNFGEYKKIGKDNLLLCDTKEDWYNNIKLLIDNVDIRYSYGDKIKKYVEDNLMFDGWKTKKAKMFEELVKKNIKKDG